MTYFLLFCIGLGAIGGRLSDFKGGKAAATLGGAIMGVIFGLALYATSLVIVLVWSHYK